MPFSKRPFGGLIGSDPLRIKAPATAGVVNLSTTPTVTQNIEQFTEYTCVALDFNADGTKAIYLLGNSSYYEVSLSTPYDISTAGSLSSVSYFTYNQGFGWNAGFSHDGTRLYSIDSSTTTLYYWDLTTAYDLSSRGSRQSTTWPGDNVSVYGWLNCYNDDGSKFFLLSHYPNYGYVYEYDLSTDYDLTSASYSTRYNLGSSLNNSITSVIKLDDSGLRFAAVQTLNTLYRITLTSAYDFSTASLSSFTLPYTLNSGSGYAASLGRFYYSRGGSTTQKIDAVQFGFTAGSPAQAFTDTVVSTDPDYSSPLTPSTQSVSGLNTQMYGPKWNSNGTRLEYFDQYSSAYQYFTASTAYDISTLSQATTITGQTNTSSNGCANWWTNSARSQIYFLRPNVAGPTTIERFNFSNSSGVGSRITNDTFLGSDYQPTNTYQMGTGNVVNSNTKLVLPQMQDDQIQVHPITDNLSSGTLGVASVFSVSNIEACAMHPDGEFVAALLNDGTLKMFEMSTAFDITTCSQVYASSSGAYGDGMDTTTGSWTPPALFWGNDLLFVYDNDTQTMYEVDFGNLSTTVNRKTANAGVLSIDQAGPEDGPSSGSTVGTWWTWETPLNSQWSRDGDYECSRTGNYGGHGICVDTEVTSGKYYAEFWWDLLKAGSDQKDKGFGLATNNSGGMDDTMGNPSTYAWVHYAGNGKQYPPSSGSAWGSTMSNGDVVGVAVDYDNGKVWTHVNGTWSSTGGDPSSGGSGHTWTTHLTAHPSTPARIAFGSNGTSGSVQLNGGDNGTFGGNVTAGGNSDTNGLGNFKYTVPTGFQGLYDAVAGSPVKLPQMSWGGIRGRNVVTGTDPDFNLANTGVLSLSELLQVSYGTPSFSTTGGVEDTTSVSGYKLHTFYNDGTATGGTGNTAYHTNHTFTVSGAAVDVELLLISGGGAGGHYFGGGGGAGAVMVSNAFTLQPGDYTVTVGAGGAGYTWSYGSTHSANKGRPSTFTDGGYASTTGNGQDHANSTFSITAVGGQGGESGVNFSNQTRPAGANSGGQGAWNNFQSWSPTNATISWPSGYSGTIHSGYHGGAHGFGAASVYYNSGGGGGSGTNANNASSSGPSNGGGGVTIAGFSSSSMYVAGGGGGAWWSGTAPAIGYAGGGNGSTSQSGYGSDATSYGSGGGGGSDYAGAGSDGLVVIRYQV